MGIDDMIKKANDINNRKELLEQHEAYENTYDMLMEGTRRLWAESQDFATAKKKHKEKAISEFTEYFSRQGFDIKNEGSCITAKKESLIIELYNKIEDCDLKLKVPVLKRVYAITIEGYPYAQSIILPREFDTKWKQTSSKISDSEINERIKNINESMTIIQKHNSNITADMPLMYNDGSKSHRDFTMLLKFNFES